MFLRTKELNSHALTCRSVANARKSLLLETSTENDDDYKQSLLLQSSNVEQKEQGQGKEENTTSFSTTTAAAEFVLKESIHCEILLQLMKGGETRFADLLATKLGNVGKSLHQLRLFDETLGCLNFRLQILRSLEPKYFLFSFLTIFFLLFTLVVMLLLQIV